MMTNGIGYKQRDIVLVKFPYSNFTEWKQRPALVLSNTADNARFPDIICCGITSKPEPQGTLPIHNHDLEEGFLFSQSRIKPGTVFTFEQSFVLKKIARLTKEKSEEVSKKLKKKITIED